MFQYFATLSFAGIDAECLTKMKFALRNKAEGPVAVDNIYGWLPAPLAPALFIEAFPISNAQFQVLRTSAKE